MKKKLYKVDNGKKLCGVCTGFALYFNTDVTLIRLILIFFTLCGGCGILLYIIAALVMPNENEVIHSKKKIN